MTERSEIVDFVTDSLVPVGHASARAMFGAWGIYLDGLIVGIVAWDTLYLKVDDANRADYEAAGSEPFTYEGRGKPVSMSYWEVPADVLEEPELLRAWALKAHAASRRAQAGKAKQPAGRRGRTR